MRNGRDEKKVKVEWDIVRGMRGIRVLIKLDTIRCAEMCKA